MKTIAGLVVFGFCVGIGFWGARKATDWMDDKLEKLKVAREVAKNMKDPSVRETLAEFIKKHQPLAACHQQMGA